MKKSLSFLQEACLPITVYTVGIRGRSTRGRDEPIHNLLEDQNILGSPRGSEGRPPSSPQRSTPSVARPQALLGTPHSKLNPSQSVIITSSYTDIDVQYNIYTVTLLTLHWNRCTIYILCCHGTCGAQTHDLLIRSFSVHINITDHEIAARHQGQATNTYKSQTLIFHLTRQCRLFAKTLGNTSDVEKIYKVGWENSDFSEKSQIWVAMYRLSPTFD
jgi:hypothetical protein